MATAKFTHFTDIGPPCAGHDDLDGSTACGPTWPDDIYGYRRLSTSTWEARCWSCGSVERFYCELPETAHVEAVRTAHSAGQAGPCETLHYR
jgi:hypothetical protein